MKKIRKIRILDLWPKMKATYNSSTTGVILIQNYQLFS